MKLIIPQILRATDGEGAGAPPPDEKKTKSGLVKVRNVGTQPIRLGEQIIDCAVVDKKGKVLKEAPVVEIPKEELKRLGGLVKAVSLFLLAGLLLWLGQVAASAQAFDLRYVQAGYTNLNGGNGSSNTIAAASAVTYGNTNSLITLTKFDGTSIQLSAKLMGAGTSAITAMFDASNDGINWVTPYTFLTVNANGTTAVSTGTNLVNQHWAYLRLTYVTNASNAVLTNLNVSYTLKPRRNG